MKINVGVEEKQEQYYGEGTIFILTNTDLDDVLNNRATSRYMVFTANEFYIIIGLDDSVRSLVKKKRPRMLKDEEDYLDCFNVVEREISMFEAVQEFAESEFRDIIRIVPSRDLILSERE